MSQEGIMQLIYEKINSMIGAGNQLFSMQFPAQPLNYRLYQYDTSDRNSFLTRPYSVAEQEFRLSDQLFDPVPITAGSNGEKLSVVYKTLLNNYIPKLEKLAPFIRDRAGLGQFLLQDSGEVDDKGNQLSRIELCKKLYQEYLNAKNKWDQEKEEKFQEFRAKGDYDGYAKWLSSFGLVRGEELNNLYNDVVVSGHLHEVLTILGYLNASSIAEELEIGKQKMRQSSRLSLDESMIVYPVQFQPNNWFKALTPNLNPQDLTMAKESIRDQYMTKQLELSRARAELQKIELLSVDPEEIKEIETKVEAAKKATSQAETALVKQYGQAAVAVANLYFKATMGQESQNGTAAGTAAGTATGSATNTTPAPKRSFNSSQAQQFGASNLSAALQEALPSIVDGIAKGYETQQELTQNLSRLTELKAKRAQLESRDWKFNKASLEQRISELQTEVSFYAGLVADVYQKAAETTLVELRRLSYRESTSGSTTTKILEYQIAIASKVTGGSFLLKVKAPKEEPKTTATIQFDSDSTKQSANIKTALETTLGASATVKIDPVDGSPKTWKLTITGLGDADVTADQSGLQPTIVVGAPSLMSQKQSEAEAEISGMFTDIVIKVDQSTKAETASSASSASQTNWGVSLWLGSASGQSGQSSGTSQMASDFFDQDIEVGFRVAKVSFDRGGWFNPQIFKMTQHFYRLAELSASSGINLDPVNKAKAKIAEQDVILKDLAPKLKTNGATAEEKAKAEAAQKVIASAKEELNNIWPSMKTDSTGKPFLLPAFPVAMAIAKDITIKVKTTSMTSSSAKSVVESSSAASGGFLCFSVGSSSSNSSSSEASFSGSQGEYFYIRIPGPQVIGYFLQFVDKDNATDYQPTFTDKGDSPVIKAFQLYDKAHELLSSTPIPILEPTKEKAEAVPVSAKPVAS